MHVGVFAAKGSNSGQRGRAQDFYVRDVLGLFQPGAEDRSPVFKLCSENSSAMIELSNCLIRPRTAAPWGTTV